MAAGTLEERLVTLETRLDSLQRQVEERLSPAAPQTEPGWKAIIGTFAEDPIYEEAMRLGREWRARQYDETETP